MLKSGFFGSNFSFCFFNNELEIFVNINITIIIIKLIGFNNIFNILPSIGITFITLPPIYAVVKQIVNHSFQFFEKFFSRETSGG